MAARFPPEWEGNPLFYDCGIDNPNDKNGYDERSGIT